MGGRGNASGFRAATQPDTRDWEQTPPDGYRAFTFYESQDGSADAGMGLGNGGETDQWQQGLTAEEFAAVRDYTTAGFKAMNQALRSGGAVTPAMAALTQALDRFTLSHGIITHRVSTADMLGGARTVDEINALIGHVVSDSGFTSSSVGFGAFDAYDDVAYHIRVPKGARAGAYVNGVSSHPDEAEFLFNRGGMYRILGAYTDSDGMVHVNLEWVGRRTD